MEKSFGLFFFLKKSKFDNGIERRIYIRVTTESRAAEVSTKQKCDKEKWNQEAGKINNDLLANLVKSRQTIVQTATKSIWIIVVLVILLNISIMISIDINRKLEQYKINDILCRAMKVNSKISRTGLPAIH